MKQKDGIIYTEIDVRKLHPSTCFAANTYYELGYSDYIPPVVSQVPISISRFQALAILHIDGHLATVESLVNQADQMTKLAWSNAQEFNRNSTTLLGVAGILGWSSEYLDDLFIRGSQIIA